jgi:hypothetical protein
VQGYRCHTTEAVVSLILLRWQYWQSCAVSKYECCQSHLSVSTPGNTYSVTQRLVSWIEYCPAVHWLCCSWFPACRLWCTITLLYLQDICTCNRVLTLARFFSRWHPCNCLFHNYIYRDYVSCICGPHDHALYKELLGVPNLHQLSHDRSIQRVNRLWPLASLTSQSYNFYCQSARVRSSRSSSCIHDINYEWIMFHAVRVYSRAAIWP